MDRFIWGRSSCNIEQEAIVQTVRDMFLKTVKLEYR